jgi:hypothetical protein
MGYKYGIWLMYDDVELKQDHIGHIIVANCMEKSEAERLYNEIIENCGSIVDVRLQGKPDFYYFPFNTGDKNKMCSWGYNGKCSKWDKYKNICDKYTCVFSEEIHTSIEYGMFPELLRPEKMKNKKIYCQICCVNMKSDFPVDWKPILEPILETDVEN